MDKTFKGNRIKELREDLGLSQRQLAENTGIMQVNISRWERALTVPNVLDLWTLAEYFNCSVDYLIGKDED